jgi:diacylglycerol O-acyltransferase
VWSWRRGRGCLPPVGAGWSRPSGASERGGRLGFVQQLTGQDASFLYSETPLAPMSGGGLAIYDPSTASGGKVTFRGLMSYIEDRLHLAPFYRRRVVRVPFDLDHPWWVEDATFDIEFHVRHIALPAPGDWRQLCIQCARLISRPLDLSKPLWEMYVIDGLDRVTGYPPGCFGILSKVHHAAIDGASGAELATVTQDLTADAPPPARPETPWTGEPLPSTAQLLAGAARNNVTRPVQAAAELVRGGTLGRLAQLVRRPPDTGGAPAAAPSTRFNRKVSAHRVVDGVTFDLDEVRALRALAPGSTVNDVILAVEGGALRAYLQDKGELPSESLTAMCPISLRAPGDTASGGNQVGAMIVPLHTDVADARRRLTAVHASTRANKELQSAIGARTLTDVAQVLPAAVAGLAGRFAATMEIRYENTPPPYNTVVTNVPGPQQPLYMAGAKMVASYGFGMVHDNMGLMNVITSYVGKLAVTATADRDMMPDPAFYAQCLQSSFDELKRS